MARILAPAQPELLARPFERGIEASFASGAIAQIPVLVRPQEQLTFGLRLQVPQEAKRRDTLRLDLIQRDAKSKRILGGIAVQINIV